MKIELGILAFVILIAGCSGTYQEANQTNPVLKYRMSRPLGDDQQWGQVNGAKPSDPLDKHP